MEDFCIRQQIVQNRIFTPKCGEVCDATLETHIYHVKLNDELVSSLQFQRVKEYELAWVDSIIKPKSDNQNELITPLASSLAASNVGFSLHRLTTSKDLINSSKILLNQHHSHHQQQQQKHHETVFVNEPKLSDLKQKLLQNKIQAEFNGGILVCNGIIALKKVYFLLFSFSFSKSTLFEWTLCEIRMKLHFQWVSSIF
jgi:cleavage and polyadenylation specificity factor subunit 2